MNILYLIYSISPNNNPTKTKQITMQQNQEMIYKVALIGPPCTGKSTYINRIITGEYEKKYIPTIGVEVNIFCWYTNYGKITFYIRDCAGDERFGANKINNCFTDTDAAILFCTKDNEEEKYETMFRNMNTSSPIIRVMNKYDEQFRNSKNVIHISAKSCYNFSKPWTKLIRTLTGLQDIILVPAPPITPPTVQ